MVRLLSNQEVDENIDRLNYLHNKYGNDDSFAFASRYKVFVIEEDNEIAAFGVLCQPHGYWWLRSCVVDKPYRGKGYQKQLMLSRLGYAQLKGAEKVTVSIDHRNTYSLNNAISCGFKFVPGGKFHNGHMYQKLSVEL